ncbi:hypothetical protein D1839_06930 [Roseburia sp. 1XD42-34]|nr:hypothetical protein [Roseburia sp. 1XD42-34]RKI79179.1 hypothetical protein D7V87_06920 [Clostridium sp. 1xD42-85]
MPTATVTIIFLFSHLFTRFKTIVTVIVIAIFLFTMETVTRSFLFTAIKTMTIAFLFIGVIIAHNNPPFLLLHSMIMERR